MNTNLDIREILDMELWQKIQDSFAEATGFAVVVVDKEGNPLLDYSNFSNHCLRVRSSNIKENCFFSNTILEEKAIKSKKPVLYQCHSGLVAFAVPLIVQDQYLGAIIAGQIRLSEEDLNNPEIKELLSDSGEVSICNSRFEEEYNDIPEASYDKLKAASELLYNLVNYLADTQAISNMQSQLHENQIQLLEEKKLRSDLEVNLREAELKSLISQINPHFLFNVLNTIGRLAFLEGATKTEEMIYEFADLMRYTLERNNVEITKIGDEIDFSRNYLAIQKTRLGERLHYRIHEDIESRDVDCPSMIIQPFIENFINYVVEPRSEGGEVIINIDDLADEVKIQILDNGPGIDKKIIESIKNGTFHSTKKHPSIGINNVNQRLNYYYGDRSKFDIVVPPTGGTEIDMIIPKVRIEV